MNRRITAVSLNTFRDYFFTPAAIILLIILSLTPFLCSNLLGDGTAEGKFRVFVTYSFIIGSIIFTAINIAISCSSISNEWKKKTLLILDVKPIKRWEIIAGKWVGMLLINIVFITFFVLAISFSSLLISRQLIENFPEDINIFTTETELFPLAESANSGQTAQDKVKPSDFMSFLSQSSKNIRGMYVIPAGGRMDWTFKGIRLPADLQTNPSTDNFDNVYLSYRFQTSSPDRQSALGYWLAGNPSLLAPFEMQTDLAKDQVHRLPIPAQAISSEGELNITYLNIDPSNISVLFPGSDFKILYPQGNYWINLLKGTVNILILSTFIFSVGLCFSCIVSHLTAILSTSILIFTSYMYEFIQIIRISILQEMQAQQEIGLIQRISYPLLNFLSSILPPLNEALPHSYIGTFILMPSSYLIFLFIRIIILGALPLLIVAVIYLSHRELGIPNE
ncbi:MAG: ABC transporter permease subunit [Candidatus Ratteibacteria bacterium]|nr:ABC transporter permease subunit [Candidatus Ratteibacteria bacterium]